MRDRENKREKEFGAETERTGKKEGEREENGKTYRCITEQNKRRGDLMKKIKQIKLLRVGS